MADLSSRILCVPANHVLKLSVRGAQVESTAVDRRGGFLECVLVFSIKQSKFAHVGAIVVT